MDNMQLLENFFIKHGERANDSHSAANLMYIQIQLLSTPDIHEDLQNQISGTIFNNQPERKYKMFEERSEIVSATGEQLIRFMRRGFDQLNQNAFIKRALELEYEIISDVLKRYKTSLNDLFIEASVKFLSFCSFDIAEELTRIYDDIRSPYAKCMALVVFGFQADETYISWIISKHDELKKLYPSKDYHDGAYFALLGIRNMLNHETSD